MAYWDNEPIGCRIARLRQEKNMTQDDLACATELSQDAIAGLETGGIKALGEFRDRLAEALGTTPDYLLNGEPYAQRMSMELVREMLEGGRITTQEERSLRELVRGTVRTRSNAKIPLNQREIDSLLAIIRGSDGY